MKKIICLSCILVSFNLFSCNSVLKFMYGVKEPRYETIESIEGFRNKVFMNDAQIIVLKANEFRSKGLLSCPDVFVFDRNGNYIPYKDPLKPNCNGPAELFLLQLDTAKEYHFSHEFSLETFWHKFEYPGCAPQSSLPKNPVDFYIFITWVNWAGKKIYKGKTVEWLKALDKNTGIRYELFFANQDFQECWSDDVKAWFEEPIPVNKE